MIKKYIFLIAVLIIFTGAGCSKQNSNANNVATENVNQVNINTSSVQNGHSTENKNVNSTAEITMENFSFSPTSITVAPGTTITVTNKDSVAHTLTSKTKGLFDTSRITNNATATLTAPQEAGEYSFYCSPHPYMTGKIIVE